MFSSFKANLRIKQVRAKRGSKQPILSNLNYKSLKQPRKPAIENSLVSTISMKVLLEGGVRVILKPVLKKPLWALTKWLKVVYQVLIQWLTIAIIFELIYYINCYFYGMADIHEYWSKMKCLPIVLTNFSWAKSHDFYMFW